MFGRGFVVILAVKKIGKTEISQKLFFSLGVFIGEKIRLEIRGSWRLEVCYGYNPYYEPYVTDKDKRIYRPWYYLSRMLLEKKAFSIKECLLQTRNAGIIE